MLTHNWTYGKQIEQSPMNRTATLVCAALAICLTQRADAQKPSVTAFDRVTVIDGTGAQPRANMTVVVSGGRIVDVFTSGRKALPAGARVIDLKGKFMIPGLIDSHVHVATDPTGRDANAPDRLRSALMGGITSVRDMAGDAIVLRALAAAAVEPTFASPRIYYAAVMGGPTFFEDPRTAASAHGGKAGEVAWMRAVTSETDIVKAVESAKQTGATGIKLYADIPPALVTRLATEAHRQGMKVWTHATIYPRARRTRSTREPTSYRTHCCSTGTERPRCRCGITSGVRAQRMIR